MGLNARDFCWNHWEWEISFPWGLLNWQDRMSLALLVAILTPFRDSLAMNEARAKDSKAESQSRHQAPVSRKPEAGVTTDVSAT